VNIAFGAWLVIAPLLLEGGHASYIASGIASGLVLLALSLPRGAVREHYGTIDRLVR